MAWVNDIPPLPRSIKGVKGGTLRQQARRVWEAGHTIRNAIDQWGTWLDQAREDYKQGRGFDVETGDSIVRAGETAIAVIRSLGVRNKLFSELQGDVEAGDEPRPPLWPWAPSDHFDPCYYVDLLPQYEKAIDLERSNLFHILRPYIDGLLRLLAESPEAAIVERIRVTSKPPQAIVNGTPFALKPTAAKLLSAIVKAGGEWVNGHSLVNQPSRVVAGMPPDVRSLIEAGAGKGFRLRQG